MEDIAQLPETTEACNRLQGGHVGTLQDRLQELREQRDEIERLMEELRDLPADCAQKCAGQIEDYLNRLHAAWEEINRRVDVVRRDWGRILEIDCGLGGMEWLIDSAGERAVNRATEFVNDGADTVYGWQQAVEQLIEECCGQKDPRRPCKPGQTYRTHVIQTPSGPRTIRMGCLPRSTTTLGP